MGHQWLISRRPVPPARGSGSVAGAGRILLFGALGMLLVSAGLADGARVDVAAGGGSALDAHVHAGSLGWITLAVLAVALRMAEGNDCPVGSSRLARGLSGLTTATVAAFVVADATGSVDDEVWTGGVALAAIVVFLAWLAVVSRRARVAWTVPRLSMVAALAVLLVGSVIGAISAGNAASGNLAAAASLASSHSAILVVPFVVLASTSVLEWSASPSSRSPALTTAGLVQVGALTLSAAAVTAGVVGHDLALVEANIPLVFAGIVIFLVRVGPVVLAAGWVRSSRIWLVTGTVGVAVDVGLFAHVVFEIGARRYVSVDTVPQWLVFSVDHVTFVAVGTTTLFGAIAAMAGQADRWLVADMPAAAGMVLGLAGTAVGLGLGSLALEQAGVAVLGVSVLAATAVAGLRVAGVTRLR